MSCTLLAAAAALPAIAAAATAGAQLTISGGALSVATPDFQAQSATLSGSAQILSTAPASPWTAIDARGSGAPWSVVASASDLVSAGTPNRTIASSNLALSTGAISAAVGADPATGMSGASAAPFTVATGAGQTNVTVVSAPALHRGSYAFTPQLDIAIPANASPSYVGAPYTATLTLTIS